MTKALKFVTLDLRPEIEFQITMHENHHIVDDCSCVFEACDMERNVSVIAEIVKKYGREAVLRFLSPGEWKVDWSSNDYQKIVHPEDANNLNDNDAVPNNNNQDPNNDNQDPNNHDSDPYNNDSDLNNNDPDPNNNNADPNNNDPSV